MNNLLIVDDEKEILEWLEELFLYDYAREIEVYTAISAPEALILLQRIQFDVVLTDIKMPGMDGFKLFHEIKENWPRCKVVFLTGYRNFDDIYQVIQHSDVRYILKSEDDETIMKAVDDSFIEVKNMLEQERISRIHQSTIEKAEFWIKRDIFHDLLFDPEQCYGVEEVKELNISIDLSKSMILFLLRIEQKKVDRRVRTDYSSFNKLEELLLTYLPKRINLHAHALKNDCLLLFFQPDTEVLVVWDNIYTVAKGALEYAQITYEKSYGESFCAVGSSEPSQFTQVVAKLNQLKKIMIAYMGGKESIILHAETIEKQPEEIMAGVNEHPENIQLLKYYLELRQKEDYMELLSTLCHQMESGNGRHNLLSMEIYYSIAVTLLQFINDSHIYEQLAFEIGYYKLLNCGEHENWMDASTYLKALSEAIFQVLGHFDSSLSERALERVTNYIDKNIGGDLTLTNLASIGGFNASYLSRLFKQIYMITVTDYVQKKRMEAAKQLLVISNEKIQDISEKTGYMSSQSFSRAFRNYTGVSPVEFREIHASDLI